MFNSLENAIEFIQKKQISAIDLKFSDLWGKWHHVTLGIKEFTSGLMEYGVGFDGSSVGFKSVQSGDMALIPDLATGFLDPFWEKPTLSFICEIIEADTKIPFAGDPREIARNSEKYLQSTGFADQSLWGPEFEFYVFKSVRFENNLRSSAYHIDSDEASWNSSDSGSGHYNPTHGGYHALPPADQFFKIRAEMVSLLENLNIPVKYHHHEVGGPGQWEIETPLLGLIAAGDATLVVKYITKMVANNHGMTVTYLPKPLFGEAGSGLHFHQQLLINGKNAFYDAKGPDKLSQTALYYIGGLLTHASAVLAFTNPSTNSYKRLIPGFEAPVNCFFSSGNRSAAIRVPKYATDPQKVRFEFRPPDATCNPYLAMAAMLMAGIDGIENQIDPTKAGFGPIDEDVLSLSPKRRRLIKNLPKNLDCAMDALEKDHKFLLKSSVFSEDLIDLWMRKKRQEAYDVSIRPHPYEIELYYEA
jgi:glutamine synthetase